MTEAVTPQTNPYAIGFRDLEEKQRLLKDRLLLIGQNLIDFREKNEQEILELKKQISSMSSTMEKMKDFLETISGEIPKFAKKEELEILAKQAKMFQPLEFVRKSELHQYQTDHKKAEKLKKK